MDTLFSFIFLLSIPLLGVGILKPEIISKLVKKELSRKTIGLSISGLMIFSLFGVGLTADPVAEKNNYNKVVVVEENKIQEEKINDSEVVEEELENKVEELDTVGVVDIVEEETKTEQVLEEKNKDNQVEEVEELFLVTNVVDGDTVDVNINGISQRLRLIGLDTPETKDPRKPVECFGQEASDKAVQLLLNKRVRLEADPTQGELDRYGRLLRYVHREDGLFFNKWMIENGYAYEYTYSAPYKYQQEFKNVQQYAQSNKIGLWADNVCDEFNSEEANTTQEIAEIQTQPTGGCVIKGNISSDDRKLYHTPDCPSYSRTKIDESKGEKWFCTEQEAVNAGWVRAGNC